MLGSDKAMSSCTNLENNFFEWYTFTYISAICDGGGWFVLSICTNILLSGASIFFGQQRFRFERQVQFILNRKSDEWQKGFQSYIFWLSLHQLFLVFNFIFLVYTNIFQLILSAILNIGFRMFYYSRGWIGSDYDIIREREDLKDIS